jgi:predicted DNA-binding transcriptional regulator YafY
VAKNSFLNRKNRIDQLMGLLHSKDSWIISELSQKLNVSQRTLARDLADIETSGVAIESDRGRGGGVRLKKNWGLGRLQLSHEEIIDLLLSLAIMEKIKSPLMLKNLKSIRLKIAQCFPQEQRSSVESLRKRIRVGSSPKEQLMVAYVLPNQNIIKHLQQAFFECKKLDIKYIDEKKNVTNRLIEPHYLLCSFPIWYIQAWDYLRNDIRFFRTDRIQLAEITNDNFKVRNDMTFCEETEKFFETI